MIAREKRCGCGRMIAVVSVGTPRQMLDMEVYGRHLLKDLSGRQRGHRVIDGAEVWGTLLPVGQTRDDIQRRRAAGQIVEWVYVRHQCAGVKRGVPQGPAGLGPGSATADRAVSANRTNRHGQEAGPDRCGRADGRESPRDRLPGVPQPERGLAGRRTRSDGHLGGTEQRSDQTSRRDTETQTLFG